jgi:hypothetical protein
MAGQVKADRACKMACGNRVPKVGLRTCAACRSVLSEITADRQRAEREEATRVSVGVAYTRGRAMSENIRSVR